MLTARRSSLDRIREFLESQIDAGKQTEGRRRIMGAYFEVALREGVTSVSMRAIAKQANLKAGSLYTHFPDGKDEIIHEALISGYADFFRYVVLAVPDELQGVEALRELVSLHVAFQLDNKSNVYSDAVIAADQAGQILPEETREAFESCRQMYFDFIISILDDIGPVDEVHVRAWSVAHILNAAPYVWRKLMPQADQAQLTELLFSIVRRVVAA